jgi:hypothetical protein
MPRPLAVDLLWILIPLGLGALALAVGRWSFRWPAKIRHAVIGLVAAVAATVALTMADVLPAPVYETVSLLGARPCCSAGWPCSFWVSSGGCRAGG